MQQKNRHLGSLEENLKQYNWLKQGDCGNYFAGEALKKHKINLKKYSWKSPEKESKYFASFLRDEAHDIHDDIKNNRVDLLQMEDGIHELRRKIRWLSIYSGALLGKVQLTGLKPGEKLSHYITGDRIHFRFNQLPGPQKNEEVITYLRGGFYALSYLIDELGKIKDAGLSTETILKVADLQGVNATIIKEKLDHEFYRQDKACAAAQELINAVLIQDDVLLHIASHFDKQV